MIEEVEVAIAEIAAAKAAEEEAAKAEVLARAEAIPDAPKRYRVIAPFPQVFFACLKAPQLCFNHGSDTSCGHASAGIGFQFNPGDIIDKPIEPQLLSRKLRRTTRLLVEVK